MAKTGLLFTGNQDKMGWDTTAVLPVAQLNTMPVELNSLNQNIVK